MGIARLMSVLANLHKLFYFSPWLSSFMFLSARLVLLLLLNIDYHVPFFNLALKTYVYLIYLFLRICKINSYSSSELTNTSFLSWIPAIMFYNFPLKTLDDVICLFLRVCTNSSYSLSGLPSPSAAKDSLQL